MSDGQALWLLLHAPLLLVLAAMLWNLFSDLL